MGAITPHKRCWQGRGSAPLPSPSPAKARLFRHAWLLHILRSPTVRFELHTGTSLPHWDGMLHIRGSCQPNP